MYKAQRDHQMGNVGQDGGFFLKLGCRGCLKLGCQEPAWGWSGLSKRKQGIEYGTVTVWPAKIGVLSSTDVFVYR